MREYIITEHPDFPYEEPKPQELIRCKDCKHRPKRIGNERNGFDFEFPDGMCPCQCDDGWYNRMPKDNWFCWNGERKEE